MGSRWMDGGVETFCPVCGKYLYIPRPWCYTYKLNASVESRQQQMLYFCSYTCWTKYLDEYEEVKRKRFSDAAYKRHQKNREKKKNG